MIIIEFSTRCELPRRKLRGRDDGNLLAAAPATPEYPSIPELLVTRVAIYTASDLIFRFLPSDPSFVHEAWNGAPSKIRIKILYTWPLVIRISRYLRTYRVR